jgi:hypothetical protein
MDLRNVPTSRHYHGEDLPPWNGYQYRSLDRLCPEDQQAYQAFSTLLGILVYSDCFSSPGRCVPESNQQTGYFASLRRAADGICSRILVTFLLAYTADIHERLDRRETFTRLASKRISNIRDTLSDIRNFHLEGLARFFEGSEIVSPSEFETFTEHLSREEAVRAWAWIPVVPHGERDHFELLMGTTGSSSPVFTKRGRRTSEAGERTSSIRCIIRPPPW